MTTLYDMAEQVRRAERQRLEGPPERPERDFGDLVDEAYDRVKAEELDQEHSA